MVPPPPPNTRICSASCSLSMSTMYLKYSTCPPWYELMAMASASSCKAARTTSSTERLWPRWITSAPWSWMMRRMMLMAASWPSNRLAAVTKRNGVAAAVAGLAGTWWAGVLMESPGALMRFGYCIADAAEAPHRPVQTSLNEFMLVMYLTDNQDLVFTLMKSVRRLSVSWALLS